MAPAVLFAHLFVLKITDFHWKTLQMPNRITERTSVRRNEADSSNVAWPIIPHHLATILKLINRGVKRFGNK
jgi:hypothetical protein